jgi:hypothetical protein
MCPPCEMLTSDEQCVCMPGFIRDTSTGLCVCPQYEEYFNDTCVCVEGFVRDTATGKCVCPQYELLKGDKCVCEPGMLRFNN